MNAPHVLLGMAIDFDAIINALVYSAIGLAVFAVAWFLVLMLTPFSIRKEIEEDQNTSLGIILGALLIGISIIIAAAVGG